MNNLAFRFFLLLFLVAFSQANASINNYFDKPLNIVVTFGKGGSTDRMARVMAKYLSQEINQPVNIINKKGDGTHTGITYYFSQPQDGFTLLCSSFPFYLINTINTKHTKYKLEDFSMINLQWFDYDFVVVKRDSKFNTTKELIKEINRKPKSITGGIIYNSSGHLMLKLIRNKLKIKEKLNVKSFADEMDLRKALYAKEIDFIIISAKSSEKYSKKLIKPLSVIKEYRTRKWDAPILNKELLPYGVELPTLNGSMRGFSVSKEFIKEHPKRYKFLIHTFRKILAKIKVQKALRDERVGYLWIGPKKSNQIIKKVNEVYKPYSFAIHEIESTLKP